MWRIAAWSATIVLPVIAVTSLTGHRTDRIVFAPPASDTVFTAATVASTPRRSPVQHTVAETIEHTSTTLPGWSEPIPDYYGGGTGCTVEQASIVANGMRHVGATDNSIRWMLTMMSRESACDPAAHNGNRGTGDDSYGLCQLNALAGHFEPDGILAGIDRHRFAGDFAYNAHACIKLWTVCGQGPWTPPYSCERPDELA